MNKTLRYLIYVAVGCVSFVTFLYWSFPYGILKETIASEASKASGFAIKIDELSPSFPLGFEAEGVEIDTIVARKLKLRHVEVGVQALPLLIGQVRVHLEVADSRSGQLNTILKFGIFDLIGGNFLPTGVFLESRKYNIAEMVNFYLGKMAGDRNTNVFLQPLLPKITVQGLLDANVEVDLDHSDFSRSVGSSDIKLVKSRLIFDESLQLPEQSFDRAQIKGRFQSGQLLIDKSSVISSSDLTLALAGKLIQKPRIENSVLDVKVDLELREGLKDQLGAILDAMVNRTTQGKLKIKVYGPMSPQPSVEFL